MMKVMIQTKLDSIPTHCVYCPFYTSTLHLCSVAKTVNNPGVILKEKPKWCPLVFVQEEAIVNE